MNLFDGIAEAFTGRVYVAVVRLEWSGGRWLQLTKRVRASTRLNAAAKAIRMVANEADYGWTRVSVDVLYDPPVTRERPI